MSCVRSVLLLAFVCCVASSGPPNILLLFPDQWRYDWDSMHPDRDLPFVLNTTRALA
eukprot:gene9973-18900_t